MRTLLCAAMTAGAVAASAAAPGVRLAPVEQWSTVFGGTEQTFHYAISSEAALSGRIGWRLSANRRTIRRGEISLDGRPGADPVELRFPIPEVKAGGIFPLSLTVSVLPSRGDVPVTTATRDLWVFPRNPFAGKREWLEDLRIHLFDPEEKTVARFEEVQIPFESVGSVDALKGIEDGILVIGEGLSFRDFRGLADTMAARARDGVPVVCLAPAGGSFELPGTKEEEPRPRRLDLQGVEIIAQLDKRLDAAAWPPDGAMASHSLALRGERGRVVVDVVDGDRGWCWLEAGFGHGGKLILCAFSMIEKWESSPTPRFLLAEVLEYIGASSATADNSR